MTERHEELLNGGVELAGRLAAYATARGWDPDPELILDVLWLAARKDAGPLFRAAPIPDKPPAPPPHHQQERSLPEALNRQDEQTQEIDDIDVDEGPEVIDVYAARRPKPETSAGVSPVLDLPSPPLFPGRREFVQACKPLMLRGPSRHRRTVDVDATARKWADGDDSVVVERPLRERRVTLTLILDFTPSMDMWRSLMMKVSETLHGCGGFRRVTTLCADADGTAFRLFAGNEFSRPVAGRRSRRVILEEGPQLVWIISDCVAPQWEHPDSLKMLGKLSRRASLAVLQVFPEKWWARTALGQAKSIRVISHRPLEPSQKLRQHLTVIQRIEQELLKLDDASNRSNAPVRLVCSPLLESRKISGLAQFLAGRIAAPMPGFQFDLPTGDAPIPVTCDLLDVAQMKAPEALDLFWGWASPAARELAKLLAVSPAISLPIARLLQSNFLHSAQEQLPQAEVWGSGLLVPLEESDHPDPERQLYRYREDIGERLRDGVAVWQRQRILEKASRFIEQNLGRLKGLSAMLADPSTHAGALDNSPSSDPLARIAADILRRQGPDFANLAGTRSRGSKSVVDLQERRTNILLSGDAMAHRFAWNADGTALAIPLRNGHGAFWPSLFTDQPGGTLSISPTGLNAVSWSPDGKLIAVACYSKRAQIWNVGTPPQLFRELGGHNTDVTSIAFSSDGRWLATGTSHGTIRLWNTNTWELTAASGPQSPGMIHQLVWIGDDLLAAATAQETAIYSCATRGFSLFAHAPVAARSLSFITIRTQAWLPKGRYLALGRKNGCIDFWNFDFDRQPRTDGTTPLAYNAYPHHAAVTSIDVSSDGRLLASKARDGSIRVLRLATGQICGQLATEPADSPYSSVAFRPKTHELAVATRKDCDVELFDLAPLAGSTRKPASLRVRIVGSPDRSSGSKKSRSSSNDIFDAAHEIGVALAQNGHSLILSSAGLDKIDAHVFRGYLKAARPGAKVVLARGENTRADKALAWYHQEVARHQTSESRDTLAIRISDTLRRFTSDQPLIFSSNAVLQKYFSFKELDSLRHTSLTGVVRLLMDENRLEAMIADMAILLPAHAAIQEIHQLLEARNAGVDPVKIEFVALSDTRWNPLTQAQAQFQAQAVIALGGGPTTLAACQIAEQLGQPVVPVASFGGTAATYSHAQRDQLRSQWPSKESLDAHAVNWLLDGDEWDNEAATRIVSLVEHAVSANKLSQAPPSLCRIRFDEDENGASGILIGPRYVLTAKDVYKRATSPAHITVWCSGTKSAVRVLAVQPLVRSIAMENTGADLLLLESELSVSCGTFADLDDDTLKSAETLIAVSTGSRYGIQSGIITEMTSGVLTIWIAGSLGRDFVGAPVLVRTDEDSHPRVVGIVNHAEQVAAGVCCRAVRIRDELHTVLTKVMLENSPAKKTDTHPQTRRLRVGIVGSAFRLEDVEQAACLQVGRLLADQSYDLVTGGAIGVDQLVAETFWKRCQELGHFSPKDRVLQVLQGDQQTPFPHGTMIRSDQSQADLSDVLIVIGGGYRASRSIVKNAIDLGLHVILLNRTTKSAERLIDQAYDNWKLFANEHRKKRLAAQVIDPEVDQWTTVSGNRLAKQDFIDACYSDGSDDAALMRVLKIIAEAVATDPVPNRQTKDNSRLLGSLQTQLPRSRDKTPSPPEPDVDVGMFDPSSLSSNDFNWKAALSLANAGRLFDREPALLYATATRLGCGVIGIHEQAFILAIGQPFKIAVVVFRDAPNLRDWFLSLDTTSLHRPYGTVCRQFWFTFESISIWAKECLSKWGGYLLCLTGHGVGGAIATLAAAEWYSEVSIQSIYTFGQPAVGRGSFIDLMALRYPRNYFRIVNDRDIVTRVPPGYRHAGQLFHLGHKGELLNRPTSVGSAFPILEPLQREEQRQFTTRGTELIPSVRDHAIDQYIEKIAAMLYHDGIAQS